MNNNNRLRKYKELFRSGEWHSHTNKTDGNNTAEEMVEQAIKNNLSIIAITEHVRKELTYDFKELKKEVKNLENNKIIVLFGCESKVLNTNGDLDATEETLAESEVIIGSFHRFTGGKKEYLTAAKNMLTQKKIDIWGHPLLYPQKKGFEITTDEWRELLLTAQEHDIIIEFNNKYGLPTNDFRELAENMGCLICHSNDSHSIKDLPIK